MRKDAIMKFLIAERHVPNRPKFDRHIMMRCPVGRGGPDCYYYHYQQLRYLAESCCLANSVAYNISSAFSYELTKKSQEKLKSQSARAADGFSLYIEKRLYMMWVNSKNP